VKKSSGKIEKELSTENEPENTIPTLANNLIYKRL
jgi:hypothetical protein